ncbi:hypothetical protein [Streptomyces viridochromogenes]|uniref:Putative Integral membrane protein n=1 Tax=Streptomyces viridochromogenes Tue57 TaxID=1160705 RepID=L8PKD0_STRVR|nr:hypothetical protein [Streptomyces viridochromogenes]ELS56689.1 putative Integral membrane protein [Streptomyces viridochromogenes Tue57]
MGTKTVDETGADTGTAVKTDEEKVDTVKTAETTDAAEVTENDEAVAGDEVTAEAPEAGSSGVGQGAGAVVAAALGVVSLTGGWIGTVAAARETLIGQLETASNAGVAKQIKEVYGDAWQTSALWAGLFALAALIVGVVVLARPAFGAPGKPQAPWIKSVAWGGVALGVIGLLLAVLKYTGVLLGLPSAG